MKSGRIFGLLLGLACLQSVMAQGDTVWLCRDDTSEYMYMKMFLSDTFPDNRGEFNMVDTGDAIDGKYINFDYQFSHDSVYLKQANGDTIYHCAPRPGYAGYKIFWDEGRAQFYVSDYDSMILWHKGPLAGHKVKMVWAQGSAGCGTPINYELMGEFTSSASWKRESIPFPVKRNYITAPDSDFVKIGLFELRMLIYNDSIGGDTSSTSAKGDLKIDNMYFFRNPAAVRNPLRIPETASGSRFFVPAVSGKVTLAIFSLKGEQLFKEPVDVMAGKKYNVDQFARSNSNLPAGWIQCVKITGPGVNIVRKVYR